MIAYAQSLEMASDFGDLSLDAIGRRLILLRELLGYAGRGGQKKFADELGISQTVWNNYERGRVKITTDNIWKIQVRFGVTSDWIYFGNPGGLPFTIARLLLPPDES